MRAAEIVGIPSLSVVNVVGSAIARETKMDIPQRRARDNGRSLYQSLHHPGWTDYSSSVWCASRRTCSSASWSSWRSRLGWREDGNSLLLFPLLSSTPTSTAVQARLGLIERDLREERSTMRWNLLDVDPTSSFPNPLDVNPNYTMLLQCAYEYQSLLGIFRLLCGC